MDEGLEKTCFYLIVSTWLGTRNTKNGVTPPTHDILGTTSYTMILRLVSSNLEKLTQQWKFSPFEQEYFQLEKVDFHCCVTLPDGVCFNIWQQNPWKHCICAPFWELWNLQFFHHQLWCCQTSEGISWRHTCFGKRIPFQFEKIQVPTWSHWDFFLQHFGIQRIPADSKLKHSISINVTWIRVEFTSGWNGLK